MNILIYRNLRNRDSCIGILMINGGAGPPESGIRWISPGLGPLEKHFVKGKAQHGNDKNPEPGLRIYPFKISGKYSSGKF